MSKYSSHLEVNQALQRARSLQMRVGPIGQGNVPVLLHLRHHILASRVEVEGHTHVLIDSTYFPQLDSISNCILW